MVQLVFVILGSALIGWTAPNFWVACLGSAGWTWTILWLFSDD